MTSAAVGTSKAMGAQRAGEEAARAALAKLGDRSPALCLVFATTRYDQPALLAAVRAVVGERCVISGCTGEGVIGGAASDETDRVVGVMLVASDTLRFTALLAEGYGDDPRRAAAELAAQVRATGMAQAVSLWVFADGLVGNCGILLEELHQSLPGLPIVGGTAGDSMEFTRTYQYCGDRAASAAVSALLIQGPGVVNIAVSHGCEPIGLPRKVTRAAGGWVYEIDGQPAWAVFKEYLEGDPQDLNADGIVHLCIGEELSAGEYVIHTPLQLDKERGALFFPGGGLPEGTDMRLTRRDPDRIVAGARHCAEVLRSGERPPAFVLQFDCAGRGRVLFGSCASDFIVRPIQERLGPETPWIGFHTYGEIAPLPGGPPRYHNYSVALCALYDEESSAR